MSSVNARNDLSTVFTKASQSGIKVGNIKHKTLEQFGIDQGGPCLQEVP